MTLALLYFFLGICLLALGCLLVALFLFLFPKRPRKRRAPPAPLSQSAADLALEDRRPTGEYRRVHALPLLLAFLSTCLVGSCGHVPLPAPPLPPPAAVPPAPPIVQPPAATPDLVARVNAVDQGIHDLQRKLGIPEGGIPPGFWGTTAGRVLIGISTGIGILAALATTTVTVYEAVK